MTPLAELAAHLWFAGACVVLGWATLRIVNLRAQLRGETFALLWVVALLWPAALLGWVLWVAAVALADALEP